MKPTKTLAFGAALIAIAGCSSNEGNAATGTAAVAPGVEVKNVPRPADGDWSKVVQETPAGGYLMGDPQAKVKLIEYASLTCPHCREFDETGAGPLIENYVKTGKVSYEFRNYLLNQLDIVASLIVRCNGAAQFFPLERAMFEEQPAFFKRVQAVSPADADALQSMTTEQQFKKTAEYAGFYEWAAMRGMNKAKVDQCLTDQAKIEQLVQGTSDATTQFPDFPGTPTFILNGKMLDKTATWDKLEPAIKAALGG